MSIAKKLGLSFAVVLAVMSASSILVYFESDSCFKVFDRLISSRYPAAVSRFEILAALQETEDSLRGEVVFSGDEKRARVIRAMRLEAWERLDTALKGYQEVAKTLTIQANRERLASIEETLPLLREQQNQISTLAQKGASYRQPAESAIITKADPLEDAVAGALRAMMIDQRKVMATESGELRAAASRVLWTVVVSTFLALLVSAILALFFSRIFSQAIMHLLDHAGKIAEGNLAGDDIQVQSKDELGSLTAAINRMKHSLRQTIGSAARTASTLATASEQLSASASQQAHGATLQRDQTSQVSAAMQEMSTTVEEVSRSSVRAAEAAREASETARLGGKVVADSLEKMKAIARSVEAASKQVRELGERSEQIGEIVGVINEIADQTNLLALNAAIEAARAGDQGRGFAVVADEVRKLAERTSKATKEIAAMIGHVQLETRNAVQAMEGGLSNVNLGVESTTQAGYSLEKIIGMAKQVGEMTTQIAAAAQQQSAATEQISHALEQIARVTGDSATGSQQSARACHDLSNLALDMQKLVGDFQAA